MSGELTQRHLTVLNVSLVLNILLMVGIIFGGLNWVAQTTTEVSRLKEKVAEMKDEIVQMRGAIQEMKDRHIKEDAKQEAANGNHKKGGTN